VRHDCFDCRARLPGRQMRKQFGGSWLCRDTGACEQRRLDAYLEQEAADELARTAPPLTRPAVHPAVGAFLASEGRYAVMVTFPGERHDWWVGLTGYVIRRADAHRGGFRAAQTLARWVRYWHDGAEATETLQ